MCMTLSEDVDKTIKQVVQTYSIGAKINQNCLFAISSYKPSYFTDLLFSA